MEPETEETRDLTKRRGRHLLPAFSFAAIALIGAVALWVTSHYRTPDTLLLDALEHGDMVAAETALRHGANPNLKVLQYWPKYQLSDYLSLQYYKIREPREYGDISLVFAEVLRQDSQAVELLLAHGANPNVQGKGTTALQIAKNVSNQAIIEMLRKAGARD